MLLGRGSAVPFLKTTDTLITTSKINTEGLRDAEKGTQGEPEAEFLRVSSCLLSVRLELKKPATEMSMVKTKDVLQNPATSVKGPGQGETSATDTF